MSDDEKLFAAAAFECGYDKGYEDGKHDGRSDERRVIVKWLRNQDGHGYDDIRANLIEDGEHLK